MLPTVVYGLEQTANDLKRLSPGGGPIDPNIYQIEFGKNRSLIASPQQLPSMPALEAPDAKGGKKAKQLEGGAKNKCSRRRPAAAAGTGTALATRTLDNALDKIRETSKISAGQDLALISPEKRFPIAVGKFMDKMIDRGLDCAAEWAI